jgi:hypothetical protein
VQCRARPLRGPAPSSKDRQPRSGNQHSDLDIPPPPTHPLCIPNWLAGQRQRTSSIQGGGGGSWAAVAPPDSRLLLSSDDGDPAAALIKLPEFMFPMLQTADVSPPTAAPVDCRSLYMYDMHRSATSNPQYLCWIYRSTCSGHKNPDSKSCAKCATGKPEGRKDLHHTTWWV